jgi:predicted RNA methylase
MRSARAAITNMLNRNYSWQEIVAAAALCGMILTGIKAFWFNEWRLAAVEGDMQSMATVIEKNKEQLATIQGDIRLIRLILEQTNGQQIHPSSHK